MAGPIQGKKGTPAPPPKTQVKAQPHPQPPKKLNFIGKALANIAGQFNAGIKEDKEGTVGDYTFNTWRNQETAKAGESLKKYSIFTQ